jgi:hypothetical protein
MKAIFYIPIFLLVIFNCSCHEHKINGSLEIYGYSIGDSITSEFQIEKRFGDNFSRGIYIKDTLVKIYAIRNHINSISLELKASEFHENIARIESILGKPVMFYIGDTIYGVKLNHSIEYMLWRDSTTNISVEAYSNTNNPNTNLIRFYNDSISQSLKNKFILENNIEERIYKFKDWDN